jgi:hypothetical protein
MTEIDRLEELAKAATPGKWQSFYEGGGDHEIVSGDIDIATATSGNAFSSNDSFEVASANAAYIAACDPSTILRLVRVARAAKVILAHLDEGARPDQIALDELRAALKETI